MKKRILSALLCLCMVMALMPTVAFAEPTSYNLWVGGVKVTSGNASNIIGGGITGKVTYDDSTTGPVKIYAQNCVQAPAE